MSVELNLFLWFIHAKGQFFRNQSSFFRKNGNRRERHRKPYIGFRWRWRQWSRSDSGGWYGCRYCLVLRQIFRLWRHKKSWSPKAFPQMRLPSSMTPIPICERLSVQRHERGAVVASCLAQPPKWARAWMSSNVLSPRTIWTRPGVHLTLNSAMAA